MIKPAYGEMLYFFDTVCVLMRSSSLPNDDERDMSGEKAPYRPCRLSALKSESRLPRRDEVTEAVGVKSRYAPTGDLDFDRDRDRDGGMRREAPAEGGLELNDS